MKSTALFCFLAFCIGLAPLPETEERYEYRQLVMGAEARIVLYAPNEEKALNAARAAFQRMIALDNMLTDWREDSELMQLCVRAGEGSVVVSDDLFEVLELSMEFARTSDGAFDVTVGPLTQLWRETRERGVLPEQSRLDTACGRTGWERVELLSDSKSGAKSVRLEAGTRLDLGGIAKGYACDKALELLSERGIESALVELGGDLVVSNAPPGREAWRVSAGCGETTSNEPIELVNSAIATSGDTAQFVIIDGKRYSHILDPRTGLGLLDSPCVSVIAKNATTADALASAISVLGEKSASALTLRYPRALAIFSAP